MRSDLLDGPDNLGTNRFICVAKKVYEMGQKIGLSQAAALNQSKGAGGA